MLSSSSLPHPCVRACQNQPLKTVKAATRLKPKLPNSRRYARFASATCRAKPYTAMLSFMRNSLWGFIVVLCCLPACSAQSRWVLPKLQELTPADAIGRGSVQLSADETTLLRNLTRKIISLCMDDPGPGDPHTTAEMFKRMRVRRVPLTPKGDSGLVVQGFGVCMCGAVGNCPFWLIGQNPHPTALMHMVGIQSFAFQESLTSDHFDLIIGSHDSAMETYLQRFKFNGAKYERKGCASLEWSDPVGNALHPPRITAHRCP